MGRLVVGRNGRRLETPEGMPVFLLAEALGAAACEARDAEWDALLQRREAQGFNALLVDLLPADADAELVTARLGVAEERGFTVLVGAGEDVGPRAFVPTARFVPGVEPVADELAEATALVVDASADAQGAVASALEVRPKLPIVAIPCHDDGSDRQACRRALWDALMAGAVGGVAYRAEGLWDWRSPGRAIGLPAAEDFAFARQAVDYFDLTWGVAWQDIVEAEAGAAGVRAMRTSSTALFYVPKPMAVSLRGDFSETFVQAIDLGSGEGTRLDFAWDAAAGVSRVSAHPFAADALYVVRL